MAQTKKAVATAQTNAIDSVNDVINANVETVETVIPEIQENGKPETSDEIKQPETGSDVKPETGSDEKQPETDEQILARLTDAYFLASDNIQKLAGVRDRALISAASDALNVARIALEKHETVIAAKIAENKKAVERENNIAFIADKFAVSVEALKALIDADKADTNTPLRVALVNVFGGKITVAKPGDTGTKLTGSKTEKTSDNIDVKQPETGSKYDTMKSLFDSGKTKAEMVAMGYTDSDFNNATYKLRYIVNKQTGGYMKNPKYHTV